MICLFEAELETSRSFSQRREVTKVGKQAPEHAKVSALWIHVSVGEQRLWLKAGEQILWQAPVSTARAGLGENPGSFKTPRGWHVIAEKMGEGAPVGTVFKSRQPTGKVWPAVGVGSEDEDLILTRILWLEGEEPGNESTRSRYIYLHGTNREDQIGQPVSHGCIRLRNSDIVELYERVPLGTRVWIEG